MVDEARAPAAATALAPRHRHGGDQPNIVSSEASSWYFFREMDRPRVLELFELANLIAASAQR